ncbi:MAG: glycosyltransferase [Proteobacteria bacterium]|nr:glycosyltransferase [Pseudomonadota bacterium]
MHLPRAEQATPVFFTIVSANYMAYAKTLMASIRENHPDSLRYVFLADETLSELNIEAGLFKLRLGKDLPVPHFEHLAFRYNILEFNTALKPFAISQLMLENPAAPVLYIDPDILLLSPLTEVFSRLSAGAMAVLTPHFTAPLEDGKSPDELAISRVGSFNLGFLATGPQPSRQAFVDWWCRKLEFGAFVDLESGLFTDQKWMDLVPGMFPGVQILRHPGYNLAYWNLPHRPVALANDGALLAGGEPVAFIHFSGVDVHHPEMFSKHQNRFDITNIGSLRPTYERYVALLQTNGYDDYLKIGYRYGKLRDGTRITQDMREIFRQKFDIGCADPTQDPFGLPGTAFVEPLPVSIRVMRLARQQLTRIRNFWPVRVLFNRLSPEARWALRRFVMRGVQSPEARALRQQKAQRALGFETQREEGGQGTAANFIGYLTGEFGVAENARLFIAAAQRAGVKLALTSIDATNTARQSDARYEHAVTNKATFPISVIFANADQAPLVQAALGPDYRTSYTVGYWYWELGLFPEEWVGSFDYVDEVWTATEFVRDAVQARTHKPVYKLRPPVDVRLDRAYRRLEFGIPDDRYVFLFSFDFQSFIERKNPFGAIDAFKLAFPEPDDRAILVLKATNGDKKPDERKRLLDSIGTDTRIVLQDQFLSREAMFGLESVVDCYVSLHRAEGFGLGLAESMALGKPVIGTAYSGNMEFMNAANSCLVGYRLIDIERNQYPFGLGKQWADPDLAQAAFHMRRLVDNPAYAQAMGQAGAAHMRDEFGLEPCGNAVANRLATLTQRGTPR